MQDSELLKAYVAGGDEAAFGELMRRYVDLVYSTALRHLNGDAATAEEVTQTVFLLAARKAGALVKHPALPGWMHRTAWQVADNALRTELRRHARELEAAQMNTPDPDESIIDQVLPLLDQALQDLNQPDRLAVLLRFFMRRPMRDVGAALGVSEEAAKMRVSRAIDKLRSSFARRGIACSSLVLAGILERRAVQAAPAAVLTRIAGRLPPAGSSGLVASFLTKTLILMSYTKPATIAVAALFLALLGVGVYQFAGVSSGGARNDLGKSPAPPSNSAPIVRPQRRSVRKFDLAVVMRLRGSSI